MSPCTPNDVRIKETDTALQDVTPSLVSKDVYSYDRFNNVTETDQYGFYGALYRKNIASYFSTGTIGGVSWDYWNIPTVNGQYGTFSGNYSAIVHIRDLPSLQQTTDASGNVLAQTTFNYDQYSLASEGGLTQWDSSVPAARGNLTTRSALLQQQSRSLSTVYNYDNAGSVVSVTDPKNNTTTVAYSNAYANAFPTLVTFPLGSQYNVQTSYDFNTGKPTSFTDMNGNVTSYKYADELERLTEVDLPDGGVTTFGYCDAGSNQSCPSGSPTNSVTKTVKQNSCSTGNAVVTDALYDGLGRTTKTHQYENPGAIVVQTLFDGMGRTSSVSNPMRSENPTDVNITAYDSLGRVKSVTAPDGSVTSTTWLGAAMTSADPAGVSKILNYDAFGRLLQVTENPGGSPFFTNYLYDALDDLTGVCQGNSFDSNGNCQSGGIGRRFIYDSLKRLTSATNPESGTIGYSYDDNGNVLTKTDARGWITCYGTYSGSNCANGYDPLNRLTAKTYFNAAAPANTTPAPAITWVWDTVSKGHLSSVSAASTSPSYVSSTQFQSYDPLGRVTQSTQTTNGNNYTFYYAYNLAGALESEIYPSARAVKTCYDSAGRALSVAGTPSSGPTTTYASNMSYAPHGAIQQLSRGDNLTETRSYNNRLQETAISLGTSGNARSAFGQDMYYCSNGAAACTTNNGNLLSLNLPYLSAQQSFSYDAINRLTAAAETSPGTGWSQSYGYDQFGNRWVSGGITTSPFTPIASTNFDANNRLQIQGTQYDASGNLSAIGGYVYQNDSEGRIATVAINGSSTLYGYDGDGRRVFKQTPANTTNYVYDASGELAAEYSTAPQTNPCLTCYLTTDHLGSTRVMTNPAGSAVSQHDYLPFGEEVPLGYGGRAALPGFQAASSDDVNQKFTGKERDSESGLDYFEARYYGSALGRFTSPDEFKGGFDNLNGTPAFSPGPIGYADLTDPQTLNMYVYTRNNPLRYIDPDGHDIWDYLTGVGNAFSSDNLGGAGRRNVDNDDYKTGQIVGDGVAVITGTAEALFGGGEAIVTSPAALTGVGALVPAAGVVTAVHGGTTAAVAGQHLIAAASATTGEPPYENTPQNQERMSQGKAPVGQDGKPVELHHEGQASEGNLKEMTQAEHRGGDNFAKNHANTGQQASQIDRAKFKQQRQKYWKDKSQQ